MKEISDGQATKIYMPTDIMDSVASLGVAGEALGIGDKTPIKPYQPKAEEKLDDPCLREESSEQTKQAAESNFQMQKSLENRE